VFVAAITGLDTIIAPAMTRANPFFIILLSPFQNLPVAIPLPARMHFLPQAVKTTATPNISSLSFILFHFRSFHSHKFILSTVLQKAGISKSNTPTTGRQDNNLLWLYVFKRYSTPLCNLQNMSVMEIIECNRII
jgi:uncharacterized protein with PQ loop repeat